MKTLCLLAISIAFLCVNNIAFAEDLTIGYLQLKKDGRYSKKRTRARYLGQSFGRPWAGAKVAIEESKFAGAALNLEFKLARKKARDADAMLATLREQHATGIRYFVIDAPADVIAVVAEGSKGMDAVLFNISAQEDALRASQCQSHLLHVTPSHAMRMDALVQFLTFKKWRDVLVLEGPSDRDKLLLAAFERAAKRYGAKIIDKRMFELGNDPRQRDQNNIALLTGGKDYDAVFVADADGEFGRNVPYHTLKPRPVVGVAGLVPVAWHWAWERHGAPQLENRFEKKAKRHMTDAGWAAWVAVKSVIEANLRTEGANFAAVRDYLLGDEIIIDGFKGNRMNFRSWNNQLRQPILLASHNWVVDRAPIRGFLHATNNLDTLGFDEHDNKCKFE